MKFFVTVSVLIVLAPFCVCRRKLLKHLEKTDEIAPLRSRPALSTSFSEERRSLDEEFDEEINFSAATVKTNLKVGREERVYDDAGSIPSVIRSFSEERRSLDKEFDNKKMEFSAAAKKNLDNDSNDERVIFPTTATNASDQAMKVRTQGKNKIPESLLIAMNDVRTADEFLRRFVVSEVDDIYGNRTDQRFIESRGPSILWRKGLSGGIDSPVLAQFARCQPQTTVVKVLENSEHDGVILWPPCVYLNRCGGCCTSELMTCRPTAVSPVNVTVLQVRYTGPQSNPFASEGVRVIPMEQHDQCTCACKELPEDCSPLQEYRKHECRCACRNLNEATRCQERLNKFWDSRDCMCKCRNPVECSTGLFFNAKTCRCEILRYSPVSRIATIFPTEN